MDSHTITMIAIVSLGAVILYLLDRYSKNEEIQWADAGKIATISSLLTGGILFAVATDVGGTVVDAIKHGASESEMFVGRPSF